MRALDLGLYLVLDKESLGERSPVEVLRAALEGGVSFVQFRDKIGSDEEFVRWAGELMPLVRTYGVRAVVNDRIEIARRIGADGVHLGVDDLNPFEARRILGASAIVGLSVENLEQALAARESPVDYFGVSAIFATPTKSDVRHFWGLDGLRDLRGRVRKPLVAIGGIHAGNASAVLRAGADGLAVVSAICAAKDPRGATRELRALLEAERSTAPLTYLRCLTIAGSDSGGGAGLQADLKTFAALGAYGLSVVTAVTAQNTVGVRSVAPVPANIVRDQLECVLQDIGVDAVKIGMLHSVEIVRVVAKTLRDFRISRIVLDPVMISSSGMRLLEAEAVQVMREELWPQAAVVTPNIPEAEFLLDRKISAPEDFISAGLDLANLGARAVLLKGGHRSIDIADSSDLWIELHRQPTWISGSRIATKNTHGTGCTLASALAVFLAQGKEPLAAARSAKDYLSRALEQGAGYRLGEGHGPPHHLHPLW